MTGYQTIPYVIAWSDEEVKAHLVFRPHAGSDGGLRLSYADPRPGDWVNGVLRARVRTNRRGVERMKKLNTRRQWRCMDRDLCQVCGGPATDPETGRIWWILVPTVFEETGPGEGRTNAPATCRSCVDIALEECPMLEHSAVVCTVADVEPAGVLADMYAPCNGLSPALTTHNVYVAWDAFARHPRALATSQVVHLRGIVPTGLGSRPGQHSGTHPAGSPRVGQSATPD